MVRLQQAPSTVGSESDLRRSSQWASSSIGLGHSNWVDGYLQRKAARGQAHQAAQKKQDFVRSQEVVERRLRGSAGAFTAFHPAH